MKRVFTALFVLAVGLPLVIWAAEGRNTIGYQGRINNASGQPLAGTVNLTFALYGVASGGTALWTETHTGVAVQNGIFNVRLGQNSPSGIPSEKFNGPDRWLGIRVNADPEMTPRSRLASVPFAFNAQRVNGKKVAVGSATVAVTAATNGSVDVVFGETFAAPPAVTLSGLSGLIGGKSFVATEITNLTAIGCRITFREINASDNVTGTANFSWIAVGE